MAKKIIAFYCFLSFSHLFAQNKLFGVSHYLNLGIRGTYYLDLNESAMGRFIYREFTTSAKASIRVMNRWHQGIEWIHGVGYSDINNQYLTFNWFGTFAQGDLVFLPKIRIYAELGYYQGNYCSCGTEDPYPISGLSYLSWTGGAELKVYKPLWIEAGFNRKILLSNKPNKYGHNLMFVGINVRVKENLK